MELEDRIKALEADFLETKEEIQQIMLDIRTFLMEVQTPLPQIMSWDEKSPAKA